jgi:hypothetical protein
MAGAAKIDAQKKQQMGQITQQAQEQLAQQQQQQSQQNLAQSNVNAQSANDFQSLLGEYDYGTPATYNKPKPQ